MPVPRSSRLYAVAMMLLFTLLGTNMAWASHDDSEPEVEPQLVEGNPACQADTVEAKIESPSAGESISVDVDGQTATVTILTLEREGTFSFEIDNALAEQVIVKGGPDANVYDYSALSAGGVAHDGGLHAPENGEDKFYGLSHISFCLVPAPAASADISLSVEKTASPTTVPEPGAPVTFDVVVTNTSETSFDLTSLTDDIHGDLDGQGDCAIPQPLAAGDAYRCSFEATVSGNAGDSETDTITAVGTDSFGNTATDSDDATVTVEDVLPTISVDKTAEESMVSEPDGDATYTVKVTNDSPEDVTISSLSDDAFGALEGDEDCQVDTVLAVGDSCTFEFEGAVSGNAGDTHTNVVTATADDDEGNTATAYDNATVTIMALSQVTPTGTECDDYLGFNADDLTTVQYSLKQGAINQTNPGVFFYYTKVIAPTSSFTVDLQQTVDDAGFPEFDVLNDQVKLYDAKCSPITLGSVSVDGGQASIDISGATEGELIVVSVKYDTGSVVGAQAPESDTVHYDFATLVDGTVTTRDVDGVDLQKK